METRKPVVSGMFYYHEPKNLKDQLSRFFEKTKTGGCLGVVSPHAGYEYSGQTAAHAINSLKPAKRFLILGPNHSGLGSEFSMMSNCDWETPLGVAKIDNDLAKELKKCKILEEDDLAHMNEHSIEVQLPFLQFRFGSDFRFVPISIMNTDYSKEFLQNCDSLGSFIAKIIKSGDVRVIASSDFSHYLPHKIAKEKDDKAIEKIKNLDLAGFFKTLDDVNASVCGYGPIVILMSIAKNLGLKKVDLIHRSSSGDSTRSFSSVVMYNAIGFG